MDKNKTNRKIKIRPWIQIFFFSLIALISINHILAEGGGGISFLSNASLHALCPFGGVVSLYQYLTVGTMVQKIHESSFVLMVLVLFLSILFGPVFCGWVCPLGSIQEWVGKLGKRLFKRRYNHFIPHRIDRWLRYLRYLVLGWVVYMTAYSGVLMFANIDPYYALFNFWTGDVAIAGLIILGVTLTSSLIVERPWCKYACPYGALLGLTNLFRVFAIKRQESSCIQCNACTRNCPMNIPVDTVKTVRNHQCISCLECTSEASCPIPATVDLKVGGK
ncbi:MAG: 4Fe-4S binding protein [Anaerolineaceae bacterium]|nr:4Fe-4S binding protein [Anaerolineaceae bacterium]